MSENPTLSEIVNAIETETGIDKNKTGNSQSPHGTG